MSDKFILIAVTLPDLCPDEAQKILFLLDNGFDRVHIRKPDWSEDEVSSLLSQIPKDFYPRLTLHQTPGVISKLPGGDMLGFQSNCRYPQIPSGSGLRSFSCHSLSEVRMCSHNPAVHYQTLSPIFDSISKPDYSSPFRKDCLKDIPSGTVALGGITPEKFPTLREIGFSGAAILGWVWQQFKTPGNIRDLKGKLMM